ncbi:hypothetical protein VOLCADRAFT_73990 [Volvox carteri f. nagariensis]|uniref:Prolyl endopeptidase n=1 Tax=Volvox carteri f. nagariensis TaxID=3068 RepID=D8TR92_VOLCA|nr:uncharacterized protein VOLCADRAFT_73990 [Volvox carteri f. nagariensis]EFJ49956.1 hypothetical protein VOLCADRAFT_73990 [Volvox carteri f. nagariensis]|eukprot:XP_002949021.1 hypothetical protein VOLCADRAFT_73990 [Volvox carteri f. nagariensis]
MRPSQVIIPITAAAASAVVGFTFGRRVGGVNLKGQLNGNDKLLSRQERCFATALIQMGYGHLFRHWPPPGVRDGEKRRLLAAAAQRLEGVTAAVEAERLAALAPPTAPQRPKLLQTHGDDREDKYYWLRDDARKDTAVLSYLKAENEYTKGVMADTEKLQEALYKEMRARIKEDDRQVPSRHHGYFYYTRQETGQQYGINCRRRVPAAMVSCGPSETDDVDESEPEQVLLDQNQRKSQLGVEYYSVGGADVSPDQRLYAWAEDTVGGEKYTLRVKELSTGAELTKPIPGMSGDFEWAADSATLFYVVKDHLDRPYKVRQYDGGADVVVYEETDEAFYVHVYKGRSERVIYISSIHPSCNFHGHLFFCRLSSQLFALIPARLPLPYKTAVQDTEYSVTDRGDWLYMTVRDKSRPNSELLVAPLHNPAAGEVLIPHSRDVKLDGVSMGERYVVVSERSGGLQRARVYELPEKLGRPVGHLVGGEEIKFEEPAYSLGAYLTGDFNSPIVRMSYTSLTTPSTIIDMHVGTGKRCVKKVAPVLGGFDQSRYVTERLWATAPDGVKVPISLVYRTGLVKLDGSDPLLLNGYGSYEISNDPYFSSSRLSLLDRGFIFAIAHIRGGGEMGRYWYEDGKLQKKTNTFTDFITAAEHLVLERRLVAPSRLCIEGRSAGGMLMGAVLNMRPDLFHAAIIGVGFVDCLTTMLDETIPLTIIEREEWGDPAADPAVYAYMKTYSPVDNVKKQAYPHILAVAGLHDPRVGYWEPAKFVAKLREHKTDSNLLLLKTEMGAGHFSVTGRFEKLKEVAFEYAFLLKTLGLLDVPLAGSSEPGAVASPAGGDKLE